MQPGMVRHERLDLLRLVGRQVVADHVDLVPSGDGGEQARQELERAIYRYTAETNKNPNPFSWTKTADEILANPCPLLSTHYRLRTLECRWSHDTEAWQSSQPTHVCYMNG